MLVLQVNIKTIRNNINVLRTAFKKNLIFVVKADCYGHGLEVATNVEDVVSMFAVGTTEEAITLANITRSVPILVLYPVRADSLSAMVAKQLNRLQFTVVNDKELEELERLSANTGTRIGIHILVSDGNGRFEDNIGLLSKILKRSISSTQVDLIGLCLHTAEIPERHWSGLLERLGSSIPKSLLIHIGGSDLAEFDWNQSHALRVGLLPLGLVKPQSNIWSSGIDEIRPAARLTCNVLRCITWRPNRPIGYSTSKIKKCELVAIIDCGFAHGIPLRFFESCSVLVGNLEYQLWPAPWMQQSAIFLKDEAVTIGEEVELFGESLPVYVQADKCGVPIEYLTTCLKSSCVRMVNCV